MRGAERLSRLLTCGWQRPPRNSERGQELTRRDLAEIVELLECELAWFGFRSVTVGPFIRVKGNTVSIDLLDRGEVLCRIELDRRSGAIRPSSSDGLRRLMTSLRKEDRNRYAHNKWTTLR